MMALSLTNALDLKRHNRAAVLHLVRRHGPVSRAGIARRSGLSKAAVTAIVQQLLEERVLTEQPDEEPSRRVTAGRPGVALSFDPTYASSIGIELADASLQAVRLDFSGQISARAQRPFESDASAATITSQIVQVAQDLVASAPAGSVRGVGLAVPGQVDPQRGISLLIPRLPQWSMVPLRDAVQHAVGVPVWLDWRAYTATLAEQWYGAARQADDFLYLNVSDGLGLGIVLDGQLVRGQHSMAGQMGHLPLDVPPPVGGHPCICGNVGCLQTIVSIPAIVRRVERAIAEGVESVLTRPVRVQESVTTFDQVIRAAQSGDKITLNVLEETGEYLGRAVAMLVNLFDQPLIILGGGITRAGDLVYQPLMRSARRYARQRAFEDVRIELSSLQPGAALVGAATMVLDGLLAQLGNGSGSLGPTGQAELPK